MSSDLNISRVRTDSHQSTPSIAGPAVCWRLMARLLLIHNPESGHDQPSAVEILGLLHRGGHSVTYQSSKLHDLRPAFEEPHDLIVVAGGDGTVTRVLKACAGSPTPVALLPVGTANNVATGLGHSGNIDDLVARWDFERPTLFYLGLARGDWGVSRFAESFGVGVLAEMISTAIPENQESFASRQHKLRSIAASLHRTANGLSSQHLTVWIDGELLSGEFLWIEATRVGLVGANLWLTASVDPSTAQTTLVLLPTQERDTFLDYLAREETEFPGRSGLLVRRTTTASITWGAFAAQMDGESLPEPAIAGRGERHAEVGVHPEPVRIVTLR